jgi:hypothetical protein
VQELAQNHGFLLYSIILLNDNIGPNIMSM